MRQKMLDGHPNRSGLFDLKHDRGGIVDVEFVVQYLVLGYASEHEALTGNIGNLALLKLAARLDLIPEDVALPAHDAYRRFRQLQHSLRLQGERYARVDPQSVRDRARSGAGPLDSLSLAMTRRDNANDSSPPHTLESTL